jgi:hypothetical protein
MELPNNPKDKKKKQTTLLTGFRPPKNNKPIPKDVCCSKIHERLYNSKNSDKVIQLPAGININYTRFLELSKKFGEFIVSLHALYLDSIIGYNILHQRLLDYQKQMKSILGKCEEASEEFQDTCDITYEWLCGEDFEIESTFPFMKQGEVKKRTERNGENYILMGRLCVVQAYTYWEEYLRKEIAIAIGVLDTKEILRKYISHDFWGEMGKLRKAIIHHNNRATDEFKKMKILKWFKPEDSIYLDFDKMKFIFAQMADCRNVLEILSIPPHTARFPN